MRSQCSGLLCPAYTHSCMFVTSCCSVTFNRWLAPCHRKTLHIMFSGQMPHMEGSEGLGAEWLFNALPIHAKASAAHCYREKKKKGERKDCGRREDEGGDGALLPNSDLISEPEHTVCEDATRHGAAPFYPVGRLVL